MTAKQPGRAGVLIVAHGERGGNADNENLARLAAEVSAVLQQAAVVVPAVLNGTPSVADGVAALAGAGCASAIVYPFFMSDGFFTRVRLPELLDRHWSELPCRLLPPLGLDPDLPAAIERHALAAASTQRWPLAATRLLIVGHGSEKSPASADATNAVAAEIRTGSQFAAVETAFLDEAPFLREKIATPTNHTLVAGFFSADGLHAGEDVPAALTGTEHLYLGAVGTWPDIADIVTAALRRALSDRDRDERA